MKCDKRISAFILFFISSFSPASPADGRSDSMRVEINVFSGNPNPFFVVTDSVIIVQLRDLIQKGTDTIGNAEALVDSITAKKYVPKSGYQGLFITDIDAKGRTIYILREQMIIKVIRPEKSMAMKAKRQSLLAFKDTFNIETALVRIGLKNGLIEPSVIDLLPARLK
jgi:hypothetical protein